MQHAIVHIPGLKVVLEIYHNLYSMTCSIQTKHCFRLSTAPHGNITPQQLSDERANSFTVFTLGYKFPNSKSKLDPMGHAGTTIIHGGPTSQCTELRGSVANSLVPETTGNPQSSCGHALMSECQVQYRVNPPWIRPILARPSYLFWVFVSRDTEHNCRTDCEL